MADLKNSVGVAASGMQAQMNRMRVIAENIANADSLALTPGGDPYTRKTITFKNVMDKELGTRVVKVGEIGLDTKTEFPLLYKPSHPGAGPDGFVKQPNVDRVIESQDMKEAQRSYEANLGVIQNTRTMLQSTLELMR